MQGLQTLSVRIANYKCFGAESYGYDQFLPMNLIIGRNNSGKSTMLDIIDYLTNPKDITALGRDGKAPEIICRDALTLETIASVFPRDTHYPPIGNMWLFGKEWIGKNISWAIRPGGIGFGKIDPPFTAPALEGLQQQLAEELGNPFRHFEFKRLLADRDLRPEADNKALSIGDNGVGATNVIQNFINRSDLPSALVEETLLHELNSIFEPDGTFTDSDAET